MNLENIKKAKEQVSIRTPTVIIELLASQLGIAERPGQELLKKGLSLGI